MKYCQKNAIIFVIYVLINRKGDINAKFTIAPVESVENHGLKPSGIKMAESVIEENAEIIAQHRNKFFNNNK